MEICVGTKRATFMSIDINKYCDKIETGATESQVAQAFALLEDIMDENFAKDGHRNRCAVNGCIALYVLGFDPAYWFQNFFAWENADGSKFFDNDVKKFLEHVYRVCGIGIYSTNYLLRWGPKGNEGAALGYALEHLVMHLIR